MEFEPCIDYSKATPPQNPLQGLVDCLYARTHARAQAMSICYADSSLLVGYLLIAFLHSEKPLKSLKLTALGGCTQSCLTCTQCVLFMTSKSVVLHISQKN